MGTGLAWNPNLAAEQGWLKTVGLEPQLLGGILGGFLGECQLWCQSSSQVSIHHACAVIERGAYSSVSQRAAGLWGSGVSVSWYELV